MPQTTVNERLRILVKTLGISIRAFSASIGVADTTTRNYLDRGTTPKSDFLTKVMRQYEGIDPNWLLTGEGEMMLKKDGAPLVLSMNQSKNHYGNNIGVNHGNASATYNIADCMKERDNYKSQLDQAQIEIQSLRQQLERADALVAAKDETISLLRGSYRNPN